MVSKEFNLSEKINQLDEMIQIHLGGVSSITKKQLIGIYEELKEDIKEFIKRLKRELTVGDNRREFEEKIDKLAGDKLK